MSINLINSHLLVHSPYFYIQGCTKFPFSRKLLEKKTPSKKKNSVCVPLVSKYPVRWSSSRYYNVESRSRAPIIARKLIFSCPALSWHTRNTYYVYIARYPSQRWCGIVSTQCYLCYCHRDKSSAREETGSDYFK